MMDVESKLDSVVSCDMGSQNEGLADMDLDVAAYVLDPAKCSQLSLEKKRELVRKIATWEEDALKILNCWNRRDLVEVLCAEMGKENKYTGLSKQNVVEILIKFSEKYKGGDAGNELAASSSSSSSSKRQKSKEQQQLQLACRRDQVPPAGNNNEEQQIIRLCQNAACRNTIAQQDQFCRRCSCSICHRSDNNIKDPSLWLICGSFAPFEVGACGAPCHLVCAFKDERVGIMNSTTCVKLDGCFRCVTCGKTTSIMGSWRRHLYVAMKARELNVMCCRLSIVHALLKGSETYKEQRSIIELAVNKLQTVVGPIDRVTPIRGHLVDRLPCWAVIQKLFAAAIESLDSMLALRPLGCSIFFVEPTPVSVVVQLAYNDNLLQCFYCCKLWHRKATTPDYPEHATYIAMRPERRFNILNLDPATKYLFKVAMYSNTRVLGVWEATFVTSAVNFLRLQANSPRDPADRNENPSKQQSLDSTGRSKGGNPSPRILMLDTIPNAESLPLNTCGENEAQKLLEAADRKRQSEGKYEYCMRVVRMLERAGYMEHDFREKFLTWFSLRSSPIERRAVSAIVDTLNDDPPTLAAQLVDAFTDIIYHEAEERARKKERGEGSSTAIIRCSRKGKEKA